MDRTKRHLGTTRSWGAALFGALLAFALAMPGCAAPATETQGQTPGQSAAQAPVGLGSVPAFAGQPYIEINGNDPSFTEADLAREPFEEYAPLDYLGRCGPAFALLGPETMPTEKRGSIGSVKPSGWHLVKYDIVDGKYLFNRCHLIAYRLAGENANERNLITGTRYLNTQGMLPFEGDVADYIESTRNHVLMRVTPVFEDDDLVARGVQLEAQSVEDNGAGISFNVYVYNVQPGVAVDYATGESSLDGTVEGKDRLDVAQSAYILNTGTKRFHLPDCASVDDMKEKNKQGFEGTRDEAIAQGYEPCSRCNP